MKSKINLRSAAIGVFIAAIVGSTMQPATAGQYEFRKAVPSFWQRIAQGLMLIIAVSFESIRAKLNNTRA
jgi:ribose/xylose/arabinose/galactoside ABC-type transport system permease subunit